MIFRVLLVGFGLFGLGAARAPVFNNIIITGGVVVVNYILSNKKSIGISYLVIVNKAFSLISLLRAIIYSPILPI